MDGGGGKGDSQGCVIASDWGGIGQSIFERASVGIVVTHASGELLRCNQAFADFVGHRVDEIQSLGIEATIHFEDVGPYLARLRELVEARVPNVVIDLRFRRADGSYRWGRLQTSVVGVGTAAGGYVVSFVSDISEQKQMEKRLLAQSEELSSLFQTVPDLCFRLDSQGVVLGYHAGADAPLYTSPGNFLGKSLEDVMPADVVEAFRAALPQLGSTKKLVTFDYWLDLPGGRRCFESRMVPMASGEIMNVVRDITERKQAEAAIYAEKERLNLTLANIDDAVISVALDRRIVLANRVAEELIGISQSEVIGRFLSDAYVTRFENSQIARRAEDILSVSDEKQVLRNVILVGFEATEVLIEERVSLARDARGDCVGFMIVFRNITEKRRLEEERLKLEKLQSLAVLAGGIAHDFNNILTGILGNVSLARRVVPPGNVAAQRLSDALVAVERAKNLTQQLLTFSKGGAPVKRVVRIDKVIRETSEFVLHGSSCTWELKCSPELFCVEVDEGQMHQVFHNLLLNACQAMPRGGIIHFDAKNVFLDGASSIPLSAGTYVQVSIVDAGEGIAQEHLAKIFDPYFTTKPKGNGLGLASVFSVIRNHAGHIAVHSTPGIGSTFTIYLAASLKLPESESLPLSPSCAGNGRILIMDDLESIRDVLGAMLTELGYEVVCSRDGEEMLEVFRKARGTGFGFDAIILDLTIPGGMGGKDALARLLSIDSEVRAIVSSGYSNDPILCDYRKYGFVDVIRKPFTVADVSRVVANVLRR
jgi:PAS domain S-box-containing protein